MAQRGQRHGETIKVQVREGMTWTRAGLALLTVASLAFGLIGGLVAAPVAQAETCNPDGTICLVTDSSTQNPLVLPAAVAIRLPEEAPFPVETTVTGEAGLPLTKEADGLWHGTMLARGGFSTSLPPDGPITLHVEATTHYSGCGPTDCTIVADFQIWALTSVVDMSGTIRRQGRFFVSTLAFTSRTPLRLEFHSALMAMRTFPCGKPKPCPELAEVAKFRREIGETGALAPGHYEVTNRIPVKGAKRVCRFREPCAISLRAYVLSEPYGHGLGSFERRVWVKIKRGENRARRRAVS